MTLSFLYLLFISNIRIEGETAALVTIGFFTLSFDVFLRAGGTPRPGFSSL
jgi:hypothetical protein